MRWRTPGASRRQSPKASRPASTACWAVSVAIASGVATGVDRRFGRLEGREIGDEFAPLLGVRHLDRHRRARHGHARVGEIAVEVIVIPGQAGRSQGAGVGEIRRAGLPPRDSREIGTLPATRPVTDRVTEGAALSEQVLAGLGLWRDVLCSDRGRPPILSAPAHRRPPGTTSVSYQHRDRASPPTGGTLRATPSAYLGR